MAGSVVRLVACAERHVASVLGSALLKDTPVGQREKRSAAWSKSSIIARAKVQHSFKDKGNFLGVLIL